EWFPAGRSGDDGAVVCTDRRGILGGQDRRRRPTASSDGVRRERDGGHRRGLGSAAYAPDGGAIAGGRRSAATRRGIERAKVSHHGHGVHAAFRKVQQYAASHEAPCPCSRTRRVSSV